MNLVTPLSNLFRDTDVGLNLCSVSDSLEARPDLDISVFEWPIPVTHIHFSDPSLDIHLEWTELERKTILDAIEEYRGAVETVTFHLSRDYPSRKMNSTGQFLPSGRKLDEPEMLRNCEQNMTWLRAVFSGEVLFENNNYFQTGAYEIVTSPKFIQRTVSNYADGLLFDLAHAKVSSHNLGLPEQLYLELLLDIPVRQIHLSRPCISDDELMWDSHDLPERFEVEELKEIFSADLLRDIPITVEHYRDSDNLYLLLASMRDCSHS